MTFQQAIKSGFKNYVTFTGRAARSEYWYWALFCVLAGIVTQKLDVAIFHVDTHGPHALSPLHTIFSLLVFLPWLALAVRRLHDVNRSGWWLLIAFTIIGVLFPLLYWKCKKGTDGENRFGADPLGGK
jgi:uncharacterized membrane protein YhaH (DUF805 family)